MSKLQFKQLIDDNETGNDQLIQGWSKNLTGKYLDI